MRRAPLLAVALLLLAASVFVTPPRAPRPGATLLQEVGRSLGGVRVLASDVLFLRADRLRAEGRLDEVPALYRAVQDLQPTDTAAADFLVALLAYDLVADAPDAAVRWGHWERAWELLQHARARHPDDPSLAVREADLLLDVPLHHPDLAAPIDARVPDRERRAMRRLLEAAEATPTLPRRGRHHLLVLTELLPVLAYERRGTDAAAAFLAMGDALLARRGDVLAAMTWLGSPDQGATLVTLPRDRYLRLGLEAVREIEAEGAAAVPAVRARLARVMPDAPLVRLLHAP